MRAESNTSSGSLALSPAISVANDYTCPSEECNDNLARHPGQDTLQPGTRQSRIRRPQLVQRRNTNFVLLTEAQWHESRALNQPPSPQEPSGITEGKSMCERLRLVPCDGIHPVFPRIKGKPRPVDL